MEPSFPGSPAMFDICAVAAAVGVSGMALALFRCLFLPLVFGLYDQIRAR
jgi:hypothetical protein